MQPKRVTFAGRLFHYKEYLLMLLPAIVFFVLFAYIPMAGIIVAFKDYSYQDGIFGSQWIGLKNFEFIIKSGDLGQIVRNTVGYNLAFIVVNNFLEIAFAIMLFEIRSKWFKRVSQMMILLPYFISWVVVGGLNYNLLNYRYGFINNILKAFGQAPVDFYNNPGIWIVLVILICAWKTIGYGMIVYIASITGIDTTIYEAAQIDGANALQRTFRITIPLLIPTIIILILLSLGNIFRGDFNMYYQLIGNNSVLWPTTDVIDTFVTRSLVQNNDIGMSAAAGFFQSVFGFITVVVANFCIRSYDKDYSLF